MAKNNGSASPFASAGVSTAPSGASTSGGFAGFAGSSGFASANNNSGSSVFGSANKPAANPFASISNTDTAFPAKQDTPSANPFGSSNFKLQSSFKPDASAQADNANAAPQTGSSLFGNNFGSALNDAANKPAVTTPGAKDEDMSAAEPPEETPKPKSSLFPAQSSPESTTPTTTPAPSKFGFASSAAPTTSVFGQPSKFGTPGGGLFGSKTEAAKPAGGLFGSSSETPKRSGIFGSTSETPKTTGGYFGSQQNTPKPSSGLFGSQKDTAKSSGFAGIFGQKQEPYKTSSTETPKIKVEEEEDAPLPPNTTSRLAYPLGESSSSSATSNAASQPFGAPTSAANIDTSPLPSNMPTPKASQPASSANDAPLPPDFVNVTKPTDDSREAVDAPLPPDFVKPFKPASSNKAEDAPLPPDFAKPKAKAGTSTFFSMPAVPVSDSDDSDDDDEDDDEEDGEEGEDNDSEGSGIDVAKDLSPSTSGLAPTPGYTPQSSFGGLGGTTPSTIRADQNGGRQLFGELSRNAPVFPRPSATSPRSPSPVRGSIPNRVIRSENMRSVSAPGMASQLLGHRKSQMGSSITSRENASSEDPFVVHHRKIKARQEAAETQPLVDEDDDEIQKILASEIQGSLTLDEFIAHSNVVAPAEESIPSQVEAVYRDINSMIDTLGLNSRALKAFIRGHTDNRQKEGRCQDDLEVPDDWVLCETEELADVLDDELYPDLEDGRVRDLDDKLDVCHELTREMHRLRAKQEDLKKILVVRTDPDQAELTRSLPLSAEQATQQNELRREFAKFSKLLAEAEEALTLLKTRIASASSASGKGKANVPTVEAVIRTITKMTSMVEKRSGDVDVLENQLRKVHLGTTSREGSPMVTPQGRRSVMFSPESTPIRNLRHSFAGSLSLSASARATPPRKKLSGFSREEKGDLMDKRARRQAVLGKLKGSVEKKGVSVWNMEDID